MALKDIWTDKVDGVDDVLAEDINSIARSVMELEEGVNKKEKVLFVTITDGIASHNAIQIAEYADNGYSVYIQPYENTDDRFALSRYCVVDNEEAFAEFSYPNAEELIFYSWCVYADGSVEYYEVAGASAGRIGDIETALDSIIAIQESLIGGNV